MTDQHRWGWRRLKLLIALLAVIPSGSWTTPDPALRPQTPASSLYDKRLSALRIASVSWMNRPGPPRKVVDVVCLVPDVPTFLEAIALWDSEHAFPILIEDVENTLRFLRAFQPGRVVRFGRKKPVEAKDPDAVWADAVSAVGRSWRKPERSDKAIPLPSGDALPSGLGPTPPGMVVSEPISASLAGAVALAAGRFQPLIRWEPGQTRTDKLSLEDAIKLVADVESRVDRLAPKHEGLGDDCDFLTLAGNWPRRYQIPGDGPKAGEASFDDLLGRSPGALNRWAYVGRLQDDAKFSVYQAMCSLFLQPESALLFNGYDEQTEPWSTFRMDRATRRLGEILAVETRTGTEEAGLAGWHQAFDPINRHGLVLINSSGGGDSFSTRSEGGHTRDVPMSVPTAVLIIHSFSAVDPDMASTIAGRWLLNGAFLYFGSLNEPFLQAFRTPTLEADLLAEGLPLGAVVRKLVEEDPLFGTPWRLHLLGDPLYRIDPTAAKAPRMKTWEPVQGLPEFKEEPPPPPTSADLVRLRWTLETALAQARRRAGGRERAGWEVVLLSIDRSALPAGQARQVYDDLLADLVTFARPGLPWKNKVDAIPAEERSDALQRSLEAREALEGGR